MGIRSKIKKKIYSYYFKKGMLKAIKEIKDKQKTDQADIPKILSDINKAILDIKEEVDLFSKAIDVVSSPFSVRIKSRI